MSSNQSRIPFSLAPRALRLLAAIIVAALPLGAPSVLAAQPTVPKNSLTANPFFILAGWMSAEYERRLNQSVSLGAGFSFVDIDDNVYNSFELKGRLYPKEHALSGFEMGLSVGVTRMEFDDDDCPLGLCGNDDVVRKKVTTPAVGIEFAYQWLIGSNQHTVIAVGGGGKRFLASRAELEGTSRVIPTMRLAVGYAW